MKKFISILLMLIFTFVSYADSDPTVILEVDAFGMPYNSPFKINVIFSEPVTGFGKNSVNVINLTVNNIVGKQDHYTMTVTPKIPGPTSIFVPANVVRSLSSGSANKVSNKLNIMALDFTLNPSSNFDLSPWTLVLPLQLGDIGGAITISNDTLVGDPTLNTGYTQPPYFYTDAVSGSMNFFAPLHGATTPGSVFPRSNLSEQLHMQNMQPTWKLNTFDSNVLSASLLVTQVPSSKKIIIGEIQDKGTVDEFGQMTAKKDLVKIYYDLNPLDPEGNTCNGCLYARIRPVPAQDMYLKTITQVNNIPLKKLFRYKITLLRNGLLTITVNDKSTRYQLNTTSDNTVGWGAQKLLFKAGVYIQDNGSSNLEGGAANFYSLQVKHSGCPVPSTGFN